jgi:hypothetical protein
VSIISTNNTPKKLEADGWTTLKILTPLLFITLFITIQFIAQYIFNVKGRNIMLATSFFSFIAYWYKYHFVPSAGITIILCSMLITTIWLVSQSVSWTTNVSCVYAFAVFWAAGLLSRAMSFKQVIFLLKICCLTAFLVTIYQAIIHYGSEASHGMHHPDFGWAMYGTTLPGQGVYLALWTFMFLPLEGKSKYKYLPFYIIFALNCLITSLFNIRSMVPILALAAIMPWFLFDKFKTFCLRSCLLLALLILTILGTSLLISFEVVKPYTTKTLSDRIKSTTEDGGSGRIELYKMGIENLTEKNIMSLLFGDGGMYTVNLTKGRDMHNIYLETVHGFGLLGLVGLITIVISITHREWNNSFQNPLGATLVAYFIVGFLIFGGREPIIWFLLGTYDACKYKENKQHSRAPIKA